MDGCCSSVPGPLFALLALHYSVDILAEHQLTSRLREFPVVVIPDAYKLADEFRRALLDYVGAGGSLVLLGERSARLLEPELGVKFDGPPSQSTVIGAGPASVSWTNGWQKIVPVNARSLAERRLTAEPASPSTPAATITSRGKGRIAAVYGLVAAKYLQTNPPAIRELIGTVMREAFPQPAVETNAQPTVDLALRRTRDGKLSVHFLNLATVQRGETEFPAMAPYPAAAPFAVRLRVPQKPAAVRWEPEGRKAEWSWIDGTLTATIPSVQIHNALIVE